jgi:hypothetical protein
MQALHRGIGSGPVTPFEVAVLEELRLIRAELAASRRSTTAANPHHVRLLDAIVGPAGDPEPTSSLTVEEILRDAEADFELAEALQICGVTDTYSLGALLRTIKRQQPHPRIRIERDGRAWLFERC